jgi:hypothetical protein
MPRNLQIKQKSTTGEGPTLLVGEFAYNSFDDTLYMGDGVANHMLFADVSAGKAADSAKLNGEAAAAFVHLAGTENITGTKNFEAAPQFFDGAYIGNDGEGDSQIKFWDDNSDTWRILEWANASEDWWAQDNNGDWQKLWHTGNDGTGSGLDADKLDGQEGTYYLDCGNFTGNLDNARLSASVLLESDIDDTPVNGATDAPVSSNWAYDHVADADPHDGYMLESNIGTGASNYLQLNGSAQIPAVDGSLLTSVNATQLNSQSASYYAPVASPALTGTPTAPTAAPATNTTQIATTAFVQDAVSSASIATGTDNRLARYNGTSGVQDSGILVDDSDNVSGVRTLALGSNDQATVTDFSLFGDCNIATTAAMHFFIDSNDNSSNKYFSWRKDAAYGAGTELMNLSEAGELTLGSNTVLTTADFGSVGSAPRQKVIEIGDWNMDTTNSVNIAHGLTFSKIVGARGVIIDDAGSNKACFGSYVDVTVSNPDSIRLSITSTNVVLYRVPSGYFDNVGYNSTSYNRGYVIVDYID